MEIKTIALARLAVFLEVDGLDPYGLGNVVENMEAIGKRYQFHKVPSTPEDFDLEKGIAFHAGRLNNIAIDLFRIFTTGIVVDTKSSTENCATVLQDILNLAEERSGVRVPSERHHFVSQIVFRSELKLSLINPILQPIADRLSMELSRSLHHPFVFEPTAVIIGPETWARQITPSAFTLERRGAIPFENNTYFSAAPLQTSEHIEILKDIEKDLLLPLR